MPFQVQTHIGLPRAPEKPVLITTTEDRKHGGRCHLLWLIKNPKLAGGGGLEGAVSSYYIQHEGVKQVILF